MTNIRLMDAAGRTLGMRAGLPAFTAAPARPRLKPAGSAAGSPFRTL